MSETFIVFAGGDTVPPEALQGLPEQAFVVAADSGLDRARESGFEIDLLVGDLDSISEEGRQMATELAIEIERHPADKDATDMELALHAARRRGARRVFVIGGHGGRLDHYLANAFLLSSPVFSGLEIEWRAGKARAYAIHDRLSFEGVVGAHVTLLALGGPARGVETTGLRWNLCGDDLEPGSTRGVSNRFTEPTASVSVQNGTLLVVIPSPENG